MEICEPPVVDPPPEANSSRAAATTKGQFMCTECDFVSTTSLGLSKHMVTKHGAPNKHEKKRMRDEEKIAQKHNDTVANIETILPKQEELPKKESEPPAKRIKKQEIDPNLYAEKEQALRRLKAIELKFGEDLDWKCAMDIQTPLPKLKSELAMVMELCSQRCGTKIAYDSLLMASKGLESISQLPYVGEFIDLEGYPLELEANKKEITDVLGEIIAQYPDLGVMLSPEMRLAILMGGAAVTCAAKNIEKKSM